MRAGLLVILLLAGCAHVPSRPVPLAAARFSAQAFFAGATRGDGRLKVAFSPVRTVIVDGHGHVEPDGTLVLDQTVTGANPTPEHRQWRIREIAPGRYTGSLSDAAGPVAGEATNGRLHLRFPMKHGLVADQWLDLSTDGMRAQSRMVISKFGITVATLDETIRRSVSSR